MRVRSSLGVPLVAFAAGGTVLYATVVTGLFTQWVQDTATSHGLLLIAAAALLVRRRWARLRALVAAPRNAGFAIIAMAMLVYLAGSLAGDIFLQRVSLPVAIAGSVIALAGGEHFRLTRASIALVLLAIPLPNVIVTYLTLPLQLMASQVAAGVLGAAGVEVVRAGNLLTLPNITLEVAEACSGMRSVISLVSVTAVGCAMLSLTPARSAFLLAIAIPIGIVGNGLRVAATGVMTFWIGERAVHGWIHELTGFAAFVWMGAALLVIHIATDRRHARRAILVQPCDVQV